MVLLALCSIVVCSAAPQDAGRYCLRATIEVPPDAGNAAPLVLGLTDSGGRRVEVTIAADRLSLGSPGGTVAAPVGWRLTPGSHEVRIRLGPAGGTVFLDREQRGTPPPIRLSGRVRATAAGAPGIRLSGRPRVQRLGEITFADDFARVATSEADPLWDVQHGIFLLNSSLSPGNSQGAFQLWASSEKGRGCALAKASAWFWDDLVAEVSGMAPGAPAAWGFILHWVDADNYHALEWTKPLEGADEIRVVRRRQGTETVLASTAATMKPGQWYRLQVRGTGGVLTAYVNGSQVLRCGDRHLAGGKVGLLAGGSEGVGLDDLRVYDLPPGATADGWRPASPLGPCESRWSDFSRKTFATDAHMLQWAHPRSQWSRDDDGGDLHWFRTRLFHDVTVAWPVTDSRRTTTRDLVLFGAPETGTSKGYHVSLRGPEGNLSRDGVSVHTFALPDPAPGRLAVSAAGGRVTVSTDGRDVATWQDPAPLTSGHVGATLGGTSGMRLNSPDWRDDIRVESTHRLDYSFDPAPTAWEAAAGTWQSTNRWACVPKWSFFGGRGRPGPAHVTHGATLLWNLRRLRGDFDLELFAAPMEGTPQRVHFAHPVALGLAFGADGRDLDSGYFLHFGTYDSSSTLFRLGEALAVNSDRVLPDVRLQWRDWYHRITQVWQHVRVQRRRGRVLVHAATHSDKGAYEGLQPLFDIEDTLTTDEDRIGIWAWGPNGLAVARAVLSFETSPGVALPSAPEPPGRPADTTVLGTTNPIPGGGFATALPGVPRLLKPGSRLVFDLDAPAGTTLSLFVQVRGHLAEAVLTGPKRRRPYTIPLPGCRSVESPRGASWRRIDVPVEARLRHAFPRGDLVVDGLSIGSPCDGVMEQAGLGTNRLGTGYRVAGVRWQAGEPPRPAPALLQLRIHGRRPLNDVEADRGSLRTLGGTDGALLHRDTVEPGAGAASVRLLNRTVAGPAGAWITESPVTLAHFPVLSFRYRIDSSVETNLVLGAGERRWEIRITGNDNTWPVVGACEDVLADGTWRQTRIDLRAALQGQDPALESLDSIAIADTWRMTTWQRTAYWLDDVTFVPALDTGAPTAIHLDLTDGTQPQAHSHCLDSEQLTDPGTTPTGPGGTPAIGPISEPRILHVRAQRSDGSWTPVVHLPLLPGDGQASAAAAAPAPGEPAGRPAAPLITTVPSDRLCLETFDWADHGGNTLPAFGDTSIRRGAWVLEGHGDGVSDDGCLIAQNLLASSFFSVFLHRSSWDLRRWPRLSFDYRFEQPGCALNLSLLVNGAMTIVSWTGPPQRRGYFADETVGSAPTALQDGAWHHVSIDLARLVREARHADRGVGARLRASELATWATNHRGAGYANPAHARVRFDNICLHSDRGRDPAFTWQQPRGTPPANGYAVVFDHAAETVPAPTVTHTEPRLAGRNLEPGVWFLHVRSTNASGWGPTAHRRIIIAQ